MEQSPNPQANDEGLCFADGKRKVDYVLVFHQRRHSSIRCPTSTSVSHDRLSIVSNGNFPPSVGSDADQGRGSIPGGEAPTVGEVFVDLGGSEASEPADHEIHLIRQEFEASLVEAGLEVERESEVSAHTLCQSPARICKFCALHGYVLVWKFTFGYLQSVLEGMDERIMHCCYGNN